MIGKVKWFNDELGYGFIEYKNIEFFIHYLEITTIGHKTLKEGQTVEFKAFKTNKGYKAKKVITH